MEQLEYFYLYDDPEALGLDTDYLGHWLASLLPDVKIGVRADFLTFHLARFSDDEREALTGVLCGQLEGAEVTNLVRPQDREKLPALPPEERGLDVVYESAALQALLRLLIPEEERVASRVHVMFTANYLGVWREDEAYLRLQATALGLPNIISTSGLVEALELPKQYHFVRQQLAVMGVEEDVDVDEMFAEETVGYGDPRLNEVCKGYLLEALYYHMTGETGCSDPECRLHIVPTHVDTVRRQVTGHPRLCERHLELLAQWGGVPEE